MKKLGLILLAITSLGLISCSSHRDYNLFNTFKACDKVHIIGLGCVNKDDCELFATFENGEFIIKYQYDSNSFSYTSNFMLVTGKCPICKK